MALRCVSRDFVVAVKLADEPAYKIAQRAGINPVTLSKLMRGYIVPQPEDGRILAVAKELGLPPNKCFAEELAA